MDSTVKEILEKFLLDHHFNAPMEDRLQLYNDIEAALKPELSKGATECARFMALVQPLQRMPESFTAGNFNELGAFILKQLGEVE